MKVFNTIRFAGLEINIIKNKTIRNNNGSTDKIRLPEKLVTYVDTYVYLVI